MRIFLVMYLFLIPAVALFIRSKHTHEGKVLPTAAIKAGCTIIIVLTSIVELSLIPEFLRYYSIMITSGLIFGLTGDILICEEGNNGFWFGMFFFALGHVCYILAFLSITKNGIWAVPIFILIYLTLILIAAHLITQHKKMHNSDYISNKVIIISIIVYSMVITAMLSLAVTILFSVKRGYVVLLGAVLFAVSDSILAYGKTGRPKNAGLDAFGLYSYFIGQSLLVVSVAALS